MEANNDAQQKTTKFEKVAHAYASRKGIAPNAFRFLLDGKRLSPQESPDGRGLEDNDNIDVVYEQTGGF